MGLSDAAKSCLSKYVTFTGRAPRSEYWYWLLFLLLAGFVLGIFMGIIGAVLGTPLLGNLLLLVLELAILLPSISVTVRRLHDINRSGWWYWLGLIPLIGAIILLIWFCTKGTEGNNRFGPDPLMLR